MILKLPTHPVLFACSRHFCSACSCTACSCMR